MKKKEKLSLKLIAFYQALGLIVYCGLVSLLFWRGGNLFGPSPSFLGPLLVIVLFSTSALIATLLTLGYPFVLFWEKKQTMQALKLVGYTAVWLVFFIVVVILSVLLAKLF
jgi:uncharacterized membrane protein YidH (DUF202 family)